MMEDRTHCDAGAKVCAIVDNAISELLELAGVESRDRASALMATQAFARIEDNEERRKVAQFAAELVWDYDDTEEPDEMTGGGPSRLERRLRPDRLRNFLALNRNIFTRARDIREAR